MLKKLLSSPVHIPLKSYQNSLLNPLEAHCIDVFNKFIKGSDLQTLFQALVQVEVFGDQIKNPSYFSQFYCKQHFEVPKSLSGDR